MHSGASFADKALAIAAKGWAVFPCHPEDKRPLVKHGFQAASSDPARIKAWGRKFPGALVGMPTGDRVFVLDIDRGHKNGADGFATLEDLGWELPATRLQRTRSGGAHAFFRIPAGATVKTRAGIAPGLDIRGVGGFIIRWDAEALPTDNPGVVAEAPDWLLAAVALEPAPAQEIVVDLPDIPPEVAVTLSDDLGTSTNLPPEQIVACLAALDPDMGHDDWVRVGMALYHTTEGEGFDYWDEWSSNGATYPGSDALMKRWNSFGGYVENPVTGASLVAMAEKAEPAHDSKASAGSPVGESTLHPDAVVMTSELSEDGEVIPVLMERPSTPLPEGYEYDGVNMCRREMDEKTEMWKSTPIYQGFLCVVRNVSKKTAADKASGKPDSAADGAETEIYAHPNGQPPTVFRIPSEVQSDKKILQRALFKKGIYYMNKDAGYILDLLTLENIALKKTTADTVAVDQMGWQQDGSFVIGTTRYRTDGGVDRDIPPPPAVSEYAAKFAPSGHLDEWRHMASLYDCEGGEPFQFALCYGAAGLFLHDLALTGVLLSLYSSDSGLGKTTVGRGALSWWGDPDALKFQTKDTSNSAFNLASAHKNLSFLIDEITALKPWQIEDIAYGLSQGREKRRMTAALKVLPPLPPWHLPVIATANNSIRSALHGERGDSQGTQARVLELVIEGLPHKLTYDESRMADTAFLENYGIAGPILVRHVMKHRDRLHKVAEQFMEKFYRVVGGNSMCRFWVVSCAATMTVAVAARETGLLSYDLPRLSAWVADTLRTQLHNTTAMVLTTEDILAQYLATNANSVLVITQRKNSIGEVVEINNAESMRGTKLAGRAEIAARELYIPIDNVRDFCRELLTDFDGFRRRASVPEPTSGQALLANGGRVKQITPTKGTSITGSRATCLVFNLKHPALIEWAAGVDLSIKEPMSLRVVK